MTDWIVDTLGRETFDRLKQLPASELWSALLAVLHDRAAREPVDVIKQYERDGFTRPSPIDQRVMLEIDRELLAAADGFDAIELSPVAPLGTCSAVAIADQNKILSALRGTEVIADPTNCLALEAALRLRARAREPQGPGSPTGAIRLATCARVVRCQPFPKLPGYAPHFRIFGLVTAGRETRDHGTTVSAAVEQVRAIWRGLDRLEQRGYAFGKRHVVLRATAERVAIADRVAAQLADLTIVREPLEHPYYDGLRFVIYVTSPAGEPVPLADGGAVDWVGKLTANRANACVVAGMGSQLIARVFRRAEG